MSDYRLVLFQAHLVEHHKRVSNIQSPELRDLHPTSRDTQEAAEAGAKAQNKENVKMLLLVKFNFIKLIYHIFSWGNKLDGSVLDFRAPSRISITVAHWVVLKLFRH